MKLFTRMGRWGVLAAMAVATTAVAQKEQWLDYHVDREGKGFRYMNLTTNAPPNVKLPKLTSQPYFAQWQTPWDKEGRWLCLDRTKKSGLYDRAYMDSNGNGRLDDETPVSPSRSDQYSAYFEPVRLVFKGEDGPITYHMAFRFSQYNQSDANLYASSAGYYGGKIEIGGKKRPIQLTDQNVNGIFNDRGADTSDADSLTIEGDKAGQRYIGKLLEVDGEFYQMEVARDGAFIKLQKAENVVLGEVKVPETISYFVAYGEQGHFVRKPAKGLLTLPEGKYRIQEWKIDRKDDKGAAWQLRAYYGFGENARFDVAKGKAVSLAVGEPMRAVMDAREPEARPGVRDTSKEVSFSLGFKGYYGETLQITKGNQNPKPPRLTLTSLDGTYRYTNTFEFG